VAGIEDVGVSSTRGASGCGASQNQWVGSDRTDDRERASAIDGTGGCGRGVFERMGVAGGVVGGGEASTAPFGHIGTSPPTVVVRQRDRDGDLASERRRGR